MAGLIGIELSPGTLRIIDVEVRRTKTGLKPTPIRRFATLRHGSPEAVAALATLKGRSAAVVVWGAPSDHRQVMVTHGTYSAMRSEASRALAVAGVETRGALVDIARVPFTADHQPRRRPVVVALASGAAVQAAIQPLRTAGIHVKLIATPATALASLARVRRRLAPESGRSADAGTASVRVDAYVAIEESAICIVLLRDGTLAAARELSWGFLERRGGVRRRDDIALRFVDELSEFLTNVGGSIQSVRQLTLCGGVPELRSLAAELTARLHTAVEALDSPFGIDDDATDAEVLERCAELWIAWAAAVDQQTPLSLLHSRQRQAAHARLARLAVAAGIVVGVGLAWEGARCALRTAPPGKPTAATQPQKKVQHLVYGANGTLR